MSPSRLARLIVLMGVGVALLLGCTWPDPAPTAPPPTATPTGALPTCADDNLKPTILTFPALDEVVASLSPELQWIYPDTTCTPEGYRIDLSTGPYFADNLGGGTGDPSTTWVPAKDLQPATEYKWAVRPINGTTLGPTAPGPGNRPFYFFTGPVCNDPSALQPPTLLEPADGAAYDASQHDGLIWDYPPACLPDHYVVEISALPNFSDTALNGVTDSPATRWNVAQPMTACQTYYWRVAAVLGGVVGPYSSTRTFVAPDSNGQPCNSTAEPGPAVIHGIVWRDACSQSGQPPSSPLPDGCVADASGVHADGFRQANEPGIAGVQVTLHADTDCTSPAVATAITDANGRYTFDGIVDFGMYCVSIRTDAPPNDALFPTGAWTSPTVGNAEPATQTVGVAAADVMEVDFGWDDHFLPAASTPTFTLQQNAFCRQGPGTNYPKVATLLAGDTAPIQGRLDNDAWFYIFWEPSNVHCWIAARLGTPAGDYGQTPALTPPPPPPPADTTPPTITDVHALENEVYYRTTACGPTTMDVAARISDAGGIHENNIVLEYRYVPERGSASAWHLAAVHDRAMGNQYGFVVNVLTEANAAMQDFDGYIAYHVIAIDDAGNKATSQTFQLPLKLCP